MTETLLQDVNSFCTLVLRGFTGGALVYIPQDPPNSFSIMVEFNRFLMQLSKLKMPTKTDSWSTVILNNFELFDRLREEFNDSIGNRVYGKPKSPDVISKRILQLSGTNLDLSLFQNDIGVEALEALQKVSVDLKATVNNQTKSKKREKTY